MIHRNRVKVLRNYIGVLYGLFFHYQQRRGGWDKQAYAAFLASIFDVDVQPENLISNSKRYIEAYEKFAEKRNFASLLDDSLTKLFRQRIFLRISASFYC